MKNTSQLSIFLLLSVIISGAFTIPKENSQFLEVNFVAGPPLTDEEFNSLPRYIRSAEERNKPTNRSKVFRDDIVMANIKAAKSTRDAYFSPDGSLRWPNATIPYTISAEYTDVQRQIIASAMNEYHKNTCIRFVPRTNERDYIEIRSEPDPAKTGCYYNALGRQEGANLLSLDETCLCLPEDNCDYLGVYVVQHELMHAAGFFHEQNRYDRDDYVIVNYTNIQPELIGAYDIYGPEAELFLGSIFDTGSVMIYYEYDYAIDPNYPTMSAIDGSHLGRDYLTETDILELNRMYCKAPGDCWDDDERNGNCSQRVAAGECLSNTADMFYRCSLSCQFCDYPPLELQPDPNCADFDSRCNFFAGQKQCQTNFEYMNVECRRACKFCSPCEDLYSNCPTRASNGDCTKPETSVFMTSFCKRSCQICL